MGTRTALADDVEARLEIAAVLTQHQLQYARGIVASAGITNPEITAAVVHALAINFAASSAPAKPKAARRAAPAASAAAQAAAQQQPDLLTPDPFNPGTY